MKLSCRSLARESLSWFPKCSGLNGHRQNWGTQRASQLWFAGLAKLGHECPKLGCRVVTPLEKGEATIFISRQEPLTRIGFSALKQRADL